MTHTHEKHSHEPVKWCRVTCVTLTHSINTFDKQKFSLFFYILSREREKEDLLSKAYTNELINHAFKVHWT